MERPSEKSLLLLKQKARQAFIAADSTAALKKARVAYLGRKSPLNLFLKQLKDLPLETRKSLGALANQIRKELDAFSQERSAALFEASLNSEEERYDLSLPGYAVTLGRLHPLTRVTRRILEVLRLLGFSYVETPEVESDANNFTALNIPSDHPARDMHDTLYLKSDGTSPLVLRTHTTPAQVYAMKELTPPMRIVTAGKVFRREAVDATHLPVFHQIDAFYVDQKVSMADLKSTLDIWASELFGTAAQVRFRPSYFPFTEPSCEVEIACFLCKGRGCVACKNGWIEMLGAGMIHPNVLARHGHDPAKWRGFAFGVGIERVAMVLWGIPDIRLLYENNLNFLEQLA